ncbi:uncharacterized protein NECHADRAFT_84651 [Fusarium vanettenii 77-13-4]|uniref:Copper homeostasis protein cutC homolog n=1 Tax=Fusarium vanettenii (strain ATCC MYA-4622 / CBS 123669 / FGSC 9596 / NRRL 45880 / 77-13-4) TaxID=660122 RepID=C7YTP2_FUSV7|nr:uncharacterized protein NECHADRAFT_84651 [Fusarium vanettenii 77-13-4]EEU44279.1 hypothetical protein NECHADRAFT_84651 [Fusarium vanettenii 77-13-4]
MAPPSNDKFPKPIPLEVSVYGTINAIQASKYGAKRLLLSHKGSQSDGGLTPTVQELRGLVKNVFIPVNCTIRPRAAPMPGFGEQQDYIYTNQEFAQMCDAIRELKDAGFMNPIRGDSFVFGCLRRNDNRSVQDRNKIVVDRAYCRHLIEIAKPYPCTFNRAFDYFFDTGDWKDALHQINMLGFKGVMTGGGHGYFNTHVDRLVQVCERLDEMQLVIAGGVGCREVRKLREKTHNVKVHTIWINAECLRPEDHNDPETVDVNGVMGLVDQLGLDAED